MTEKEKKVNVKLLEGEYQEVYKKVDIYLRVSEIGIWDQEAIMEEILDLFLSAQRDHININRVIGDDYESFCNQMMEEHQSSFLKKHFSITSFDKFIFYLYSIQLIIGIARDYSKGIQAPWSVHSDITLHIIYYYAISLAFYCFNSVKKRLIFKYKWYTKKINYALEAGELIFVFLFLLFITPDRWYEFFALPRYILLIGIFLLYVCTKIILKKDKETSMKNNTSHNPFHNVAFNLEIERYQKKYNNYLKKCAKRNISKLTVQDWYEKQYQNDKKTGTLVKIFFSLIMILMIVLTSLDSTMIDTIMFAIINTSIQIPIIMFMNKGDNRRKLVYNTIKKSETDIFDDSLLKEI